jgi:hypothetical protein
VIKAGSDVVYGIPADYPQALVDAITEYLKIQQRVKAAWLVRFGKRENSSGDYQFSNLLIVDCSGGVKAIFDGIGGVVSAQLDEDEYLDIMPREKGLSKEISKEFPPFYRRKKFGLF